jgi:hypothetical protein
MTVLEKFEEWHKETCGDALDLATYNCALSAVLAAVAWGRAQGREEQRRADLAVLTSLPRIQVEGQWMIDLDVAEQRITEAGEGNDG